MMPGDTILPSPRPLLIWLGADAFCALALTLLALALLALWRRPSRPWRLGMAATVASWLAIGATIWTLLAYNAVKVFNGCANSDDCAQATQSITNAVLSATVMGVALVAVTLAALLGGVIFSARASRESQASWGGADGVHEMDGTGRGLALVFADLVASVGALMLALGIIDWIGLAPLVIAGHATDAIGLIPLTEAVVTTIGGAVIFGFGLVMLLMASGALNTRWLPSASSPAA